MGKALKLHQVGIFILLYLPCCTCRSAFVSGKVTCKQSLACVAVNEVFGNRERLVLAGANSVACSSLAGSSSNSSETAMESWWTKPHKIKVTEGTAAQVYSTNSPVWRAFVEVTHVVQTAGFFISKKHGHVGQLPNLQLRVLPLSPASKDWITSICLSSQSLN